MKVLIKKETNERYTALTEKEKAECRNGNIRRINMVKALIKKEIKERSVMLTEKEKAEVDRILVSERKSPTALTTAGIEGVGILLYTVRFLWEDNDEDIW
jgi:hypothetical protein